MRYNVPSFTSCVIKPRYEKTNVPAWPGTAIEYTPLRSVTTAIEVPFSLTFTPGKGRPIHGGGNLASDNLLLGLQSSRKHAKNYQDNDPFLFHNRRVLFSYKMRLEPFFHKTSKKIILRGVSAKAFQKNG